MTSTRYPATTQHGQTAGQRPRRTLCLVMGALFVVATSANAQPIMIDFGLDYPAPSIEYGAAANVPGGWNIVGLGTSALLDGSGATTAADITVVAATAGGNATAPTTEPQLLLNDNFFVGGGSTWTVSFAGLTNGRYLAFIYAPTNGSVGTGDLNLNGTSVPGILGDAGGTLVRGVSWLRAEIVVTDGTFDLSGTGSSASGLAGLQLIPVQAGYNIDLGVHYAEPSSGYGAASGQSGVWNRTGLVTTALVDVLGYDAGVEIEVGASFDTGFGGVAGGIGDTAALLEDTVFAGIGSPWTIEFSGLVPGEYALFVYAPSNGLVETGNLNVGDVIISNLPGTSSSDLIEGTSWSWASVETTDGTLVLSIEESFPTGLAGIQLVPLSARSLNLDLGTRYDVPSDAFPAAGDQAGAWDAAGLGSSSVYDVQSPARFATVHVAASSDQGSGGTPANDTEQLLDDNIWGSSGAGFRIDLAGIARGRYQLLLYAPSNTSVSTGDVTVDGMLVGSLLGDSSGNLLEGVSWLATEVVVLDGTLSIEGEGPNARGLSGLQLVPLVEGVQLDLGIAFAAPPASYGAASYQGGEWNRRPVGTTQLLGLDGLPGPVIAEVRAASSSGNYLSPATDDGFLMRDFVFSAGGSWIVKLDYLTAGDYAVFVYAPASPSVATGPLWINGFSSSSLAGDSGANLIENISWRRVDITLADGESLLMRGAAIGASNVGVAGIQVVPAPEPAGTLLLGAGVVMLGALGRRRGRGAVRSDSEQLSA